MQNEVAREAVVKVDFPATERALTGELAEADIREEWGVGVDVRHVGVGTVSADGEEGVEHGHAIVNRSKA